MHKGEQNNQTTSQCIYAKIAFVHGDAIPHKDKPNQTNGDVRSSISVLSHQHGDLFWSDYELLAS